MVRKLRKSTALEIGEVLALRWRHIHADRITVQERVYEGEFDDVKTDAGEREVPFDKRGLMTSALIGRWKASKHRLPDDLVFSTRKGGALGRRNLLRHIKGAAAQLARGFCGGHLTSGWPTIRESGAIRRIPAQLLPLSNRTRSAGAFLAAIL